MLTSLLLALPLALSQSTLTTQDVRSWLKREGYSMSQDLITGTRGTIRKGERSARLMLTSGRTLRDEYPVVMQLRATLVIDQAFDLGKIVEWRARNKATVRAQLKGILTLDSNLLLPKTESELRPEVDRFWTNLESLKRETGATLVDPETSSLRAALDQTRLAGLSYDELDMLLTHWGWRYVPVPSQAGPSHVGLSPGTFFRSAAGTVDGVPVGFIAERSTLYIFFTHYLSKGVDGDAMAKNLPKDETLRVMHSNGELQLLKEIALSGLTVARLRDEIAKFADYVRRLPKN